jgi:hypothetical protein
VRQDGSDGKGGFDLGYCHTVGSFQFPP